MDRLGSSSHPRAMVSSCRSEVSVPCRPRTCVRAVLWQPSVRTMFNLLTYAGARSRRQGKIRACAIGSLADEHASKDRCDLVGSSICKYWSIKPSAMCEPAVYNPRHRGMPVLPMFLTSVPERQRLSSPHRPDFRRDSEKATVKETVALLCFPSAFCTKPATTAPTVPKSVPKRLCSKRGASE
jgi:hypothetical protein